jgi:hypothetical protein
MSDSKGRKVLAGTVTPDAPESGSAGQSGANTGRSKSGVRPKVRKVRTSVQHPIARRIMAELHNKPVHRAYVDTPIVVGLVYRVFYVRGEVN